MRIEASTTIDAPRERVFEVLCDAANYTQFMAGMTRWEPEKADENGAFALGSRYRISMHVGSADVGGLIEVIEFDAPSDIAWTSVTGLDQRGRWMLRERDHDKTELTVRFSYQAPGGMLGTLSDRISSPLVKRNLNDSLDRLKARFESSNADDKAESDADGGRGISARAMIGVVGKELETVRVLVQAGVVRPERPDKTVRTLVALSRWGPTPAAGYAAAAVRCPDEPAIIDERGSISFRDVHRRTNALARALAEEGISEGDKVAVMCRNHRGFIEATVALSKLGAHTLFMNTGFAAPQFAEVAEREDAIGVIFDQEFEEVLSKATEGRKRFIAWVDDESALSDPTLDDLISATDDTDVVPPEEPGRTIILTSGTTGTPKGATRKQPDGLSPAAALFSRIPLRSRETWVIAAPLFHSWGFAHFTLGLALNATYVLQRKFDPEATLAAIEEHGCTSLPVVPVMLQRMLELDDETRRKHDTSSLRTVPASGSALPGDLATRFMDEYGDILYNLYGSTEVAWATIATPEDMRAAPGTAGQPPLGTTLKIYDENGDACPPGETGRIFVGNEMLFEGYTGGGTKDMIGGLMATGDVGHIDSGGRLFVEGRDDDMIVSGGENVFPQEVEDLIAKRSDVLECAVIGVEDEQFGQRLKAFVVRESEASPSEDELKDYIKDNLARYKVPREIDFIDELPRNQTGKVLKRELIEREREAEAGSAEAEAPQSSG